MAGGRGCPVKPSQQQLRCFCRLQADGRNLVDIIAGLQSFATFCGISHIVILVQASLFRSVLPHLPQLATVPSSLHFFLKLVEAENERGHQLLALNLLTDSSLAQLAVHPTGHLLLERIVALRPGTHGLIAASWICKNLTSLVASPSFAQFAATVLQILQANNDKADIALTLER